MNSIQSTILILLVLGMTITSCSSQKKLQVDVPFEMGTTTVQEWLGGKEESGTGFLVTIPVSALSKEVRFQELYFRGQIKQVTTENDGDGITLKANFVNKSQKSDIIMHADPKKEVGNQPPSIKAEGAKDFPFGLNSQEAVLGFIVKNRMKYVKISAIKEKQPLIYSTKPKN